MAKHADVHIITIIIIYEVTVIPMDWLVTGEVTNIMHRVLYTYEMEPIFTYFMV